VLRIIAQKGVLQVRIKFKNVFYLIQLMVVVAAPGNQEIHKAGFNVFQKQYRSGQIMLCGKLHNKIIEVPFAAGYIKESILLIFIVSPCRT